TSLAGRGIINGYPDGSFRPNAPVNRAEFATMVATAFPNAAIQNSSAGQFSDISSGYWARSAMRSVSQRGFLSGYPDGSFRPTQNIPRAQALIALSSGLNYQPVGSVNQTLETFNDDGAIPAYARSGIAAATEEQIVVNYPTVQNLRPNQVATRAEVAAFLCQALKTPQDSGLISSQYIPGGGTTAAYRIPAGTLVPVAYEDGDRIIVSASETAPVSLELFRNLRSAEGDILIPQGSVIKGQLEPRNNGSQFVAQSVIIDGQEYDFRATSQVITRTTSVQDPNLISLLRNAVLGGGAAAGISTIVGDERITPAKVLSGAAVGAAVEANQGRSFSSILRDTVIGAAIATGISSVVGDETITAEKILSGAAAGATLGGVIDPDRTQVVIIEPETDLALTMTESFTVPN
ncbi:MAG: S-layer homology domain-containing protein, partial [Cyanobacteria bacterium P01_F01_bin.3]